MKKQNQNIITHIRQLEGKIGQVVTIAGTNESVITGFYLRDDSNLIGCKYPVLIRFNYDLGFLGEDRLYSDKDGNFPCQGIAGVFYYDSELKEKYLPILKEKNLI